MSLGRRLATKLDELLNAFKFFFASVFIFYLISAIYNSVWASQLSDKVFLLLYNAKKLRDFTLSLAVLSFTFLFILMVLGGFIYMIGAAKFVQLILFVITISSMLGTVVLMGFSIKYSSNKMENILYQSFLEILSSAELPEIVKKWAEGKKCDVLTTCADEAKNFVHGKKKVGYIFEMVLILCICISLFGLITTIFCMGLIKPVDRNIDTDESSDNEDTLTKSAQLEQPTDARK